MKPQQVKPATDEQPPLKQTLGQCRLQHDQRAAWRTRRSTFTLQRRCTPTCARRLACLPRWLWVVGQSGGRLKADKRAHPKPRFDPTTTASCHRQQTETVPIWYFAAARRCPINAANVSANCQHQRAKDLPTGTARLPAGDLRG
jgi:hypothetical protein